MSLGTALTGRSNRRAAAVQELQGCPVKSCYWWAEYTMSMDDGNNVGTSQNRGYLKQGHQRLKFTTQQAVPTWKVSHREILPGLSSEEKSSRTSRSKPNRNDYFEERTMTGNIWLVRRDYNETINTRGKQKPFYSNNDEGCKLEICAVCFNHGLTGQKQSPQSMSGENELHPARRNRKKHTKYYVQKLQAPQVGLLSQEK